MPLDESAMDDLFREILAPSPLLSSTPLPLGTIQVASQSTTASPEAQRVALAEPMIDWEGEAEMQRLLDMLPDVASSVDSPELLADVQDFPSSLDLGLSAWDLALMSPAVPAGIAAF